MNIPRKFDVKQSNIDIEKRKIYITSYQVTNIFLDVKSLDKGNDDG
jgi:hypothetical protein